MTLTEDDLKALSDAAPKGPLSLGIGFIGVFLKAGEVRLSREVDEEVAALIVAAINALRDGTLVHIDRVSAARREGAEGWQPIETAPHKDGWIKRCLFGVMKPWGWSAWVGQRDDYDMWLGVDEEGACWDCEAPTHWCPLPSPPAALTRGGTHGNR